MQPTAATIYQTLGSLVYGEGEEPQDAVVRRRNAAARHC